MQPDFPHQAHFSRNDILRRLKTNTQWYNKSYEGYFFGIYQQGISIAYASANYGSSMPYGVLFLNKNRRHHMDWFWDAHSMQQKRESLLQKAQSKHFIVKFYQKWQDLLEKYLKYYNSMSHLELKQYSLTELKTKFQKLHELYIKAAGYGYIVDVFLSEGADWLELKIKQELGKKATPEVMATLTLPVFPSFVNKAQVLFLSIVQAIQQGETQNEVRDLCQKYVDHYFWIKATYLDHERLIPEKVY